MKNITEDLNTLLVNDANNGHKFPLNLGFNISQMDPLVKIYFGLLLIAPFLAFFIRTYLNAGPYYVLGNIATLLVIILALKKKLNVPKYIYPLIILFFYYSIWNFFNGRVEEFGIIELIFKNYTLHTISILLIIENVNFNYKFINASIKVFKILALLSIVVIFIQFIFKSFFFTPKTIIGLSSGEFNTNNSIWGYLTSIDIGLSFLPIMALLINDSLIKKKLIQSLLWLVISGLVAFMTNARWIMINFSFLLFLPIYLIPGSKIKNIAFSLIGALIVILLLNEFFNVTDIETNSYIENRILSKSANSRLLAIDLFSEYFPLHPFLGSGVHVGNDLRRELAGRSSQIHVGYLSHLYEFGIVGSVFLFLFWFFIAKIFYRTAKISKQYGIFIGFLCFLLANLTLVEYSSFYMGLIFLFVFNRFYRNKYVLNNIAYLNNSIIK